MKTLSWAQRVEAWSHVPVDDVGYFDSAQLLTLSDAELSAVVERHRERRYGGGWRNAGGALRAGLGLDEIRGARVLDYGCGIGLEAAELARLNQVWVADLSMANVALATRVADLRGTPVQGGYLITEDYPYVQPDRRMDVIHSCGVLHHCREPRRILARWAELLQPRGRVRLLLYAPAMWREAVGTEPPEDVETDPGFAAYVAHCDGVGDYADWYDPERLSERADGLFTIQTAGYAGQGRLLVATLRKQDRGRC